MTESRQSHAALAAGLLPLLLCVRDASSGTALALGLLLLLSLLQLLRLATGRLALADPFVATLFAAAAAASSAWLLDAWLPRHYLLAAPVLLLGLANPAWWRQAGVATDLPLFKVNLYLAAAIAGAGLLQEILRLQQPALLFFAAAPALALYQQRRRSRRPSDGIPP